MEARECTNEESVLVSFINNEYENKSIRPSCSRTDKAWYHTTKTAQYLRNALHQGVQSNFSLYILSTTAQTADTVDSLGRLLLLRKVDALTLEHVKQSL